MTTLPENTFAAACYDQNSVAELQGALTAGPDDADMAAWGLTAAEWTEQVKLAIAALIQEDRDLIAEAASNEPEIFTDSIKHLYNCREAELGADGSVWISDPQRPHWLNDDERAFVAKALRAGDI